MLISISLRILSGLAGDIESDERDIKNLRRRQVTCVQC
jgi:hypothetical protein